MIYDFSLQDWNGNTETFRISGADLAECIGNALAAWDDRQGTEGDPASLSCHQVIETFQTIS